MSRIETIKVEPWSDSQGDFVIINKEDFDPSKHVEYQAADDGEGENYSKAVLKAAREFDVDLSKVIGTGANGNVTVKDVKNFVAENNKPYFENEDVLQLAVSLGIDDLCSIQPNGKDGQITADDVRHHFEKINGGESS